MVQRSVFLILSLLTVFSYGGDERKLYVGKNSTEAVLTFSAKVQFESKPSKKKIDEGIESQVDHLFGPMSAADIKAVPKDNHDITDLTEAVFNSEEGVYEVGYHYRGTIVVESSASSQYVVILPINPAQIYEQAKVGNKKPCTDSHYDESYDFWYFWNPYKSGCRLKEGEHFVRISGQLKKLANTKITYPEYDRLVRTVDGKKVISISVLFGMDDGEENRNPLKSKDINAKNFRDSRNALLQMGFQAGRVWSEQQIEKYFDHEIDGTVYVEELTKQTPKATIVARLFFGPSDMEEESQAFHYFFKDALENQSVMFYDGHSGLGDHLDLETIEEEENFKIRPSQSNYQLYFFNSCSSYSYYNTMYFDRKKNEKDSKGTKNLDILTNGLSTYFTVLHDTNMAVIRAIDLWAMGKGSVSFQALAKQIDSNNLFGVNGDEDNPTSSIR